MCVMRLIVSRRPSTLWRQTHLPKATNLSSIRKQVFTTKPVREPNYLTNDNTPPLLMIHDDFPPFQHKIRPPLSQITTSQSNSSPVSLCELIHNEKFQLYRLLYLLHPQSTP